MRTCPKCGAEYADTDFRTLCGYCMSSLAPATAIPSTETPASRPVQVGGEQSATSVIPITVPLPEITVPEFALPWAAPAPEMPVPPQDERPPAETALEPKDAPRKPGPYRPPLTPQPNPAIPQPLIIPVPEPEREPAVPQPAPVPQPVPWPEPDEPQPTATMGRVMTAEELSTGRLVYIFYFMAGIGAIVLGLSIVTQVSGAFWQLGILLLMIAVTGSLMRKALYHSIIHAVKITAGDQARPGESVPLEVSIGILREVDVSDVELTLTGNERATRGTGSSATTYRHTFYRRKVRMPAPSRWPGEREVILHVDVPIPTDAIPSFAGRRNAIEWSTELWVGITGLPDIRERMPVTVAPVWRATPPLEQTPVYELPQLGPLNAQLGLRCPVAAEHLPIFQLGRAVPFVLRMSPQGDFQGQRVSVELACLISGSGESENLMVARQTCTVDSWLDDPGHEERGVLAIPPNAPVTYSGKHLRIHWAVTVRHEKPWGQDSRQIFEVQVVPAHEG